MGKNDGLVPTQVTDKNGVLRTVYVRMDPSADQRSVRQMSGPPRPMNSRDQRITDLGDQLTDDDIRVFDCIEFDNGKYYAKGMPFMNVEADPDPENALKQHLEYLGASDVEYEINDVNQHGGMTVTYSSNDAEVITRASSYMSEGKDEDVNVDAIAEMLEMRYS